MDRDQRQQSEHLSSDEQDAVVQPIVDAELEVAAGIESRGTEHSMAGRSGSNGLQALVDAIEESKNAPRFWDDPCREAIRDGGDSCDSDYFRPGAKPVSPWIIKDFETWLSDSGDQVVAIDVRGAEGSNRYFGDYSTDGKVVFYRDVDGTSVDYFSYEHIGRTVNGIHVLKTKSSGGGSGTFVHLLFLRFEVTKSVDQYRIEDSLLLRKVGSMVLGDRWVGELEVVGNVLTVRTIGYSWSNDDDSGEESLDFSGI